MTMLEKMLYIAYRDLSKKWTMPIRNWVSPWDKISQGLFILKN